MGDNMTNMNINITFEAALVDVSDPRQAVGGARVSVGGDHYDVIAPEGDGLDCWGADEPERALTARGVPSDVAIAALHIAAESGGRGESGCITINDLGVADVEIY